MQKLLAASLALALTTVACAASGGPAAGPSPSEGALAPCVARGVISEGEQLPGCRFDGLEGDPGLAIAELLGTPAVLNFWASWCTFCVREMPEFEAVSSSVGEAVTFVGLNVLNIEGETRGAAETFRERTGVTYRMVYDPDGAFYSRFQPNVLNPVMPITIFADQNGTVMDKHFGPLTEQQLRDRLRELFGL